MQSLDANEALVVYKQDQETHEVTRYVQFGPTLFMPQAHEWFVIIYFYFYQILTIFNKLKIMSEENT